VKLEEQRKQNIQYALIALGIIVLLTLYLSLSRSFISNTKLIQFFGVIALLIVFEFLNLLLHPFLERVTHHSPVLMLLALQHYWYRFIINWKIGPLQNWWRKIKRYD
jgi:predicted nucleic acid-binding Zn ribbon protein